MAGLLLNVAEVRLRSRVNGPGVRAVVWVQGCTRGCPGCFTPHTHPHEPRRLLDPVALGARLAAEPGLDGVTLSGGEPFEQAAACAALAAGVRGAGRTVVAFSGFDYVSLRRSPEPAVARLLAEVDLLVAGPYAADLRTDAADLRASANQTLEHLTGRLRGAVAQAGERAVVEVQTDGRALSCSGFPARKDRRWLRRLQPAAPAIMAS